jgi:HlyD family secretion protein
MDTLIERKKRFTPRRIYGGAGVLFILVFVFYSFKISFSLSPNSS